jgi:NAD(P)-dependent dehydrogenase (short-subunit alcohol dehydrogenase family)
MKTVLITGSTRGIGYGLADSFLALNCAVTISGRTRERVDEAVTALAAKHPAERIFGHPCDVTQYDQVQALWDAVSSHFGRVGIWINNAGVSQPVRDFWELEAELIKNTVETNLTGAMNGAKVALNGMLAQGHGAIYNMEGMGSNGRKQAGMSLYGCTKYGLAYLTDSLALEAKGTPVLVGAIQPGMVVTDLLTRNREEQPDRWEENKRIFNILADRVETVTPWLAERILANEKHGARISWLNQGKIMFRFLSAPFSKRDLFQ